MGKSRIYPDLLNPSVRRIYGIWPTKRAKGTKLQQAPVVASDQNVVTFEPTGREKKRSQNSHEGAEQATHAISTPVKQRSR
ncbi:hypothetical protein KFK09_004637 [Dendrobium nobile]|uniref:Uncharacterized protein n=1 Tax=Dendrobium nobile TaxID=94219 RepID=A0A8T3C3E0_DENNO|nr:hypothetical protein KFK09_004637 [Dendrobium nobile]